MKGAVGFAYYGSTLARGGYVQEGCRFGELSLKIIKRHGTKELMARTLQRVGLNLRSYTEPLRYNTATMLEVRSLGMATGDVETAMYAATTACGCRFYAGDLLPSIAKDTEQCIAECMQYGQHATSALMRPLLQSCFNLMGQAAGSPVVLTGEAMNENQVIAQARITHNTGLISMILMLKFVLATYVNDVQSAETISEQLRQVINRNHPPSFPILWTFHQFYEGLVAATIARMHGKTSFQRSHHLRIARRRLKTLQETACHCPENLMNKVHMLEGDLAVCTGKYALAESKYRQSIVFAEHEGFLPEQALACEKLAQLLLIRDPQDVAKAEKYICQATTLYEKYGATVLASHVRARFQPVSHGADKVLPERAVKGRASGGFYNGCYVPLLSERDFQIGCC